MDRTLARFCSVNAPCSTRMRPRCPPERCCVWIALSSCSRVTIFSSKRICPSDSVRALARCPLALGAAPLDGGVVGVVWGRTDARSPARSLVAGGWGLSVVGGSLAAGSVGGSAVDVSAAGGGSTFGGGGAADAGGCLTGGGGTGAGGSPFGAAGGGTRQAGGLRPPPPPAPPGGRWPTP